MADQIFIQHRFIHTEDGLSFSDAIVLPEVEYEALRPEDIEVIKAARFTGWKAALEEMKKEKTKEDLLRDRDDLLVEAQRLEEELAKIPERIAELEAEIVKRDDRIDVIK